MRDLVAWFACVFSAEVPRSCQAYSGWMWYEASSVMRVFSALMSHDDVHTTQSSLIHMIKRVLSSSVVLYFMFYFILKNASLCHDVYPAGFWGWCCQPPRCLAIQPSFASLPVPSPHTAGMYMPVLNYIGLNTAIPFLTHQCFQFW